MVLEVVSSNACDTGFDETDFVDDDDCGVHFPEAHRDDGHESDIRFGEEGLEPEGEVVEEDDNEDSDLSSEGRLDSEDEGSVKEIGAAESFDEYDYAGSPDY